MLRRLDTPENIAYWESVEEASQEVKRNRTYHLVCREEWCNHGDGKQKCDAVIKLAMARVHPDDKLVEAWELMTTGGVRV